MVKLNFDRRAIQGAPSYSDPVDVLLEFSRVLADAGLNLTGLPDASGKINRVPTAEDRGRAKSGWYVAFDGEVFGAAYGNFKTGEEGKWSSVERTSMTASQIAEHQRQMHISKMEREKAQDEIYKEAAHNASEIMDNATAGNSHAYLTKKNIQCEVAMYRGAISIPAYDANGNISTVQFIKPDGDKKFLTGGRKKGSYHLIDGEADTVYNASDRKCQSKISKQFADYCWRRRPPE